MNIQALATVVERLRREIMKTEHRHEKGSAVRKRKVLRLAVHNRGPAAAEFAEFTRVMIGRKQTLRGMLSTAMDELRTALDAMQA